MELSNFTTSLTPVIARGKLLMIGIRIESKDGQIWERDIIQDRALDTLDYGFWFFSDSIVEPSELLDDKIPPEVEFLFETKEADALQKLQFDQT